MPTYQRMDLFFLFIFSDCHMMALILVMGLFFFHFYFALFIYFTCAFTHITYFIYFFYTCYVTSIQKSLQQLLFMVSTKTHVLTYMYICFDLLFSYFKKKILLCFVLPLLTFLPSFSNFVLLHNHLLFLLIFLFFCH